MSTETPPCRACTDFKQWTRKSSKSSKTGVRQIEAKHVEAVACPPDSSALGRATWTFLHTAASYYPERPTLAEQRRMSQLISSLSYVYPCGTCAEHLREEMQVHPPDVGTRTGLEQWLCRTHNEVNRVLGKPLFDCKRVRERWRDGPSQGQTCLDIDEELRNRNQDE